MEILAVIVASWLLVTGLYGVVAWLSTHRGPRPAEQLRPPRSSFISGRSVLLRSRRRPRLLGLAAGEEPKLLPERASAQQNDPDVEVLRAQVERLKAELAALSSVARVTEKPRPLGPGVPANLSSPLRRNVRVARTIRSARRRAYYR